MLTTVEVVGLNLVDVTVVGRLLITLFTDVLIETAVMVSRSISVSDSVIV